MNRHTESSPCSMPKVCLKVPSGGWMGGWIGVKLQYQCLAQPQLVSYTKFNANIKRGLVQSKFDLNLAQLSPSLLSISIVTIFLPFCSLQRAQVC